MSHQTSKMDDESDVHLFTWEKGIWVSALTHDRRLTPATRWIALKLIGLACPRVFDELGGMCVPGSLCELAHALHLGIKATTRAIEELRRVAVISWSTLGVQFHLHYLDREETAKYLDAWGEPIKRPQRQWRSLRGGLEDA